VSPNWKNGSARSRDEGRGTRVKERRGNSSAASAQRSRRSRAFDRGEQPLPRPSCLAPRHSPMSLAIVHSRAQEGVAAPPVTVEVHLSGGLPGTSIVGLPETAVKEARDRVRVAIQSAQLEYPSRRVTVSLAPADLPKD